MAASKNNLSTGRRGTFTCRVCGKKTRDTGDNGECSLCPVCYAASNLGNEASDYDINIPGDMDPWDYFEQAKTVKEIEGLRDKLNEINHGNEI